MYLKSSGGYYKGTEQHCRKAPFLILIQSAQLPFGKNNLRAIVRKVALSQIGHFMMGIARIKNQSIILSGSYRNDGLPKTVNQEIFELGIPIPEWLYDKWAFGGGWNSAGTEANDMRKWALSIPEFKPYL
jgi:hypothetical protein